MAVAVGKALSTLIEQEEIDILVLTVRRRSKLARWALGRAAEQPADDLTQHAAIPVRPVQRRDV